MEYSMILKNRLRKKRSLKHIYLTLITMGLFTTCNMFTPGLGDVVDISAPELRILTPEIEPMTYTGSDFTITGTVSDDIGVKSIMVSWPGLEKEAKIDGTNWSVTVPVASITSTGPVVFAVVATDTSGKETVPAFRTITIDNTAPTVLITSPQVFNPGPENSNYIIIKGELWDSSPIESVRVEIIDPTSPGTPIVTQSASGDRLWSARIDLDSSFPFVNAQTYLYRVVAEDVAGNISNYQYHSADFWYRLPDGEFFPIMSDIGKWDQYGNTLSFFTDIDKTDMKIHNVVSDLTLDFTYNSDKDKPQISLSNLDPELSVLENTIGQNVPIYASATDDKEGIDRDSVSLNITGSGVDLTIPATEFNSPGDGLFMSFQFDLSGTNKLDSGQYNGVITLDDNKGTNSTLPFAFLVNKGTPNIVNLTPSSTFASVDINDAINLIVEISDDNSGAVVTATATDEFGTALTGAITTSVLVAEHQETVNSETVYMTSYNVNIADPVPDKVIVQIFATDSSNLRNTRTVEYDIDRNKPEITISVPSSGDNISGTALTAAGTSSDVGSNIFNVELFLSEGEITVPPGTATWLNAQGNTTWTLPLDLSAYLEGRFTIFAKAFDVAGNEGDFQYVHFDYDMAAPTINLNNGTAKEYFTSDFNLDGTLSDSNGLDELTIRSAKDGGSFSHITGSPFSYSSKSDTWTLAVTVNPDGSDDGIYEYEFSISDLAGKTESLSKTVVIDTTAPNLVVSNLENGDSVNSTDYRILGLASDLSGIQNQEIEYLLNGVLPWTGIPVSSTGNWYLDVTGLSEGAGNTIAFRATDDTPSGNSFELPLITFGLDLNPPELTITDKAALNGSFVSTDFDISGTSSDVNGIDHMEISTDGGLSYSPLGAFSSSDSSVLAWNITVPVPAGGVDDGYHAIWVKAVDTYNKETTEAFSLTYDTTPPELLISNLSDGDSVESSSYEIKGTATDLSGISLVEYNLNTDPITGTWLAADGTNNWKKDVTGLSEGSTNFIAFRATDNAGHTTTSAPVNFRLDLSPPTLTIAEKATLNGTFVNTDFVLSGITSDVNGIDHMEISTDGGLSYNTLGAFSSTDDSDIAWSISVSVPSDGSEDGNHVIRVKSIDSYNKETIESLTVKYDTTAPTFVLTNLVDDQLITTILYTALGSWSDNGGSGTLGGLSDVQFKINGDSWASINATPSASVFAHNFSFSELTDQALDETISFKVIDALGNESAETVVTGIDIDTELPVLTEGFINSEDTHYNSNNVTMTGSVYDTLGLSSFTVSVNGGAEQPITPAADDTWSYELPNSTEGFFELVFTAKDVVNRTSTISRNIMIDTAAPIIEFDGVVPVVDSNIVNATIDWMGSISEENIETLQYQLPGGALTDLSISNNKWEVIGIDTSSAIFTEDAVNNLRIVAIDKAGLTTDLLYPIYVDQDSDYPTFTYTNVDSDNDTVEEAGSNLLETGAKIIGSISDDDGVNKDTVEVQIYNSSDVVHTPWAAVSNPPSSSGTLVNWTQDLSGLSDGVYSAEFRTNDTNGLQETTAKVYFAIDLNPAALSVDFPSSGSYHNADFSITGTASDVNGLKYGDHDGDAGSATAETEYIQISEDGGTSWVNVPVDGSGNWSYPVSAPGDHSNDGLKNYQVKATDIFDKSSTSTLNFTIDTLAPSFTIDSSTADIWTLVNYLSINGTSDDSNGVVSVRISLDNTNWTTVNGTITWNNLLDISSLAEQENKTLYFEFTDIAANVTSNSININIDRTAPVIEETNYPSSVPVYESSDYSLNGTLTENLINSLQKYDDPDDGSADLVEYIEIIVNSGVPEKIPVSLADTWDYPVSFTGGIFEYQLQITDKAGNTSIPISRTVIADNSAPSVDSITSPSGSEQFISGTAYSISGTASDAGVAGIDKVYRVITEKLAAYPGDPSTGDFTGWTAVNGLNNWSDSLDISETGTGEGEKTLHVFTVDKAENVSAVTAVDFTIDQATPLIDNVIITPDGEGPLTNNSISLNKDFVISGTVRETNGFEYFQMKIGSGSWVDLALTDANSDKTYDWSYAVDLEDGNGSDTVPDGSYEYQFRARDLAGRDSIIVQKNVFADTEAPSVSFINLDSNSIVNGTIYNVLGTTTDTLSTITSVSIAVKGPGDAVYGTEQSISGNEYSWNYDLDLKPSGTYYDDTDPLDFADVISLRVTASDSVGNTTEEFLDFNIDQEDDKPTLSLSNINPYVQGSTITISDSTHIFSGVLFDPAGVDIDSLVINVDSVQQVPVIISGSDNDPTITWFVDLSEIAGPSATAYSFDITALNSSAAPVSGNYSGIINRNIDVLGSGAQISGSAEDDDAFDTSTFSVFQNGIDISASSDINIGSNSTYVPWSYSLPATDDLYYFEINGADISIPSIPVDWIKYGGESLKTMVIKDSSAPVVTITSPDQGAYVNGSVYTSGEAYDDLAINTLTITALQSDNVTSVELTSDSGVALDMTETTGEYYYDSLAGKYVWNFLLERLPDAYENDSVTLIYEAEDIIGNKTSKERSITIDTEDPIIEIQYPSDGALVTGDITIRGITSDEKIDVVEIRRGNTATSGGAWEALPGTYNWSTTFNSVATAVIDDSTDNGDGTYNYPVEIRATDAAGNQTIVSSYSFNISPDMDKPVLSVTTPTDNSTLGGEILFIGTATDNEAVASVWTRIDINGDGDYEDTFDLNNDSDTSDNFEREVTWYEITDYQNSVWKLQINGDSTLYRSNAQITGSPEDFIHIQFKAIDIEGSESIVLSRTLTLDETFPEISGFGLSGGGTDISGMINLVGTITDNEGITSVDISYNGGLSYESVYSGSTLSYPLTLSKNSATPIISGGLGYTDSSAIVKVRLKVTDTTGYQSFSNLELNVDNVVPTGSYTGKVNDIGNDGGTGVEDIVTISGTAKDVGVVSSFDRVEVYIVQDSNVITPLTGAVSGTDSIDFNDGNGFVPYPLNATDLIVIDEPQEQGVTDTDGDGFIEDISYASGETTWATWFDTGNIDSNTAVEVHYVIYDKAGNSSHYVEIMLIVGSDLDSDGTVEASEKIAYPQAFQARRGLLYFELFGGTKAGFNIEIDDNLGNATESTATGTTQITIDTSNVTNYPEGDAVFTLRVYDGVDLKISKTLSVDIKGADVEPPILTMTPLTQSSVIDGHLDEGDTGNGTNLDISGTVKFEGTVTDDTMIQDIVLNIEGESPVILAEWDAGLFTPRNGAEISSKLDWKTGHSVSFSYEWDSSEITTVAELDLDITFTVRDFANPVVTDVTAYDIVPYISSISRTGFNTNRSKLGFYPLRRGETGVKIYGYNLRTGGTNDSVLIGAVPTTNSSASGVITTNIPSSAASGKLLVTVNNVLAINNMNSNASTYNRENNQYIDGTELWTDDRYIHVWQSDDNQTLGNRGYFTGSENPIHPAMTIDGTGLLYASWSNYGLADVLINTNASDTTTQIFSSYDPAEHTDISFGNDISVAYNANTYGNGTWDANGAGGVEVWSKANDRTFAMEELYHNRMLMQFINQRIQTVGSISHISYYDTVSNSLKYDRKDLTSATTTEQATWINIDGGFDADDGFTSSIINSGNYNNFNRPTVTTIHVSEGDLVTTGQLIMTLSNNDTFSALQDGTISQIFVTVGEEIDNDDLYQIADYTTAGRVVEQGNAVRSASAGEYSAVDVTPTTNYPVIAYYDVSNQRLKLAYSNNTNPDEGDWSLQGVTTAGSYTGKYVSMRIDNNGYIHLAYYKTSTGDLIYLKSTNNPTDGITDYTFGSEEVLDSIGSVGMWADLSLNGTSPVISYLDASRVNTFDGMKVATIESTFDTNYDSVVDALDVMWETQNLPLAFEVDSKRTSIEYDIGSDNFWDKAIGYASSDYYRIAYYVPE